ncbi:Nudix family hydrolase [Candidatus Parabeggiatoa sp. HSG14]|uniref:Nudix family hydrolase n=1 Tax=Candidatus Parabeggiatoa sp. HSG14 TaxID=3055593 RepID=UPI0025A89AA9|nr:Nudix family hydrolase [Thiotrichales bacterium HSG14]
MKNNEILHVIAGVICNSQGEILLARRPNHLHQGGLWEFPGGKCEAGESIEQALVRELQEEIDIIVQKARPLIRVIHAYPDKKVLLDVWQVEKWQGQPWGREGQSVQWCSTKNLKNHQFPAANYPVITAIQLPSSYLITPEPLSFKDKNFFYRLEMSLDKGIFLVQLRAKNLSERDYCYCAEKALILCDRYKAQLLVNATHEIALLIGANGVHLNSEQLFTYTERPLKTDLWVAASCHRREEIQQANQINVDFIVLSPVYFTPSHSNAEPLGWFKFFQLTEQANCPVFALGGMKKEDVQKTWAHGSQGIAAIRALWNFG